MLTWTERAPSRILQPQDTGPALAFSADAPRAPSRPRHASCWRCSQMCLRHAAMSSVIIPPGCRFMPANQRNRQNFQKLCKSLLTVTKRTWAVWHERPLALWNLWDLRAVARCLQWKTFGADIGHQMPLAWVMQSCSVFGCRRSDSFPENVLLASR